MQHVYLIVYILDPKFDEDLIKNIEVVADFMLNIKWLLETGSTRTRSWEREDLVIDLGPIRKEVIVGVVKKMKSGKTEGLDSIPPKVLKADPEATADILISLLQEAWDREEIPGEWRMGYIVKLP